MTAAEDGEVDGWGRTGRVWGGDGTVGIFWKTDVWVWVEARVWGVVSLIGLQVNETRGDKARENVLEAGLW